MLVKAATIIGLPVFTRHDGKKLDVIRDVLYHPRQNRIAAFLIETGSFFSEAKVIVFEDILSIGEDAVLIESADVLQKSSAVQHEIESIAKSEIYLTGIKILTESGIFLGIVSDIYFDSRTGHVEEFEVTQGDIRNLESPRRRVKISDIVTLGKDVTIVKVPENAYHEYAVRKSESRGIMRAIQNMRQAVKEHLESMTRNSSEPKQEIEAESAQDVPQELPDEKLENVGTIETASNTDTKISSVDANKKQAVVGLYLTKNILTLDDQILAKEGDIVTHKLLDEAEAAGIIDEVINNVTHHMQLTS